MLKYVHLEQTDSTNAFLQRKQSETDIRNWVVSADEQTAGKGMGSNTWESEAGKNLTFSFALDMRFLPAARQFLLSEAVALGLVEALGSWLPAGNLHIKWPNDIYFGNRKLAGILINSTIKAGMIDVSIVGIGLNVNQTQFHDWPTHPVSMRMITGKEYDLRLLLGKIAESINNKVEVLKTDPSSIEQDYLKRLFRYRTWAEYEVDGSVLRLYLTGIDEFGRLLLKDMENKTLCFDIKEIKFLL